MLERFWRNVVHGVRLLRRQKGFAAVAALSLALGVGANTIVFSLLNVTLLRPLKFVEPDRLMAIWQVPEGSSSQATLNVANYDGYRDQNRSFEMIGAYYGGPAGVRSIGADGNGIAAERLGGVTFTPSLFQVLRVRPIHGRVFTASEGEMGKVAPVVVISYRFWQRRFNGDLSAVGQVLNMNRVPTTIIGVMPEGFDFFGDSVEFFAPLDLTPPQVQSRQGFLTVVARLKPGVSQAQAQSDLATIIKGLAISDPERNRGFGVRVESLQESAYGDYRTPLLILQGAVGFVLLIGCANVAGLLLARGSSRRTELALRAALGDNRRGIVAQLLIESVPLSVLGGLLGLGLSYAGLKLFIAAAPPTFPRLHDVALDFQVLGFTAFVVIVTTLGFAVVPAVQASRMNLVNALRDSGRTGTSGASRQRLRRALVTAQIALTLILLVGAGLMINSFIRVQSRSLGADPRGVLTFDYRLAQNDTITPFGRYRGVGLWQVSPVPAQMFDRVWQRMQRVPGVVAAAGVNLPPLDAAVIPMQFLIEGRASQSAGNQGETRRAPTANYFAVTPNYFNTMRIRMLRGRDFTERDTASSPLVMIINETMARRFFAGEEPIGKRVRIDFVPDEQPREIVAVVSDSVSGRLRTELAPAMYVPHGQQASRWLGPYWPVRAGMIFALRTVGDPLRVTNAVTRALAEVDPNTPAANIRTVEQSLDAQVLNMRVYMQLLAVFALIAVILAAIGIYGVIAYLVSDRTREIGVRMALGAATGEVLRLVMGQATLLICIGVAVGLAGAYALSRMAESALFGVTATDPLTYAAVSAVLIVIAGIASAIPASKAIRIAPTITMRSE